MRTVNATSPTRDLLTGPASTKLMSTSQYGCETTCYAIVNHEYVKQVLLIAIQMNNKRHYLRLPT